MLHFTEDSKTPNFVQFYIAVRDNKDSMLWPAYI